MNIGSLDRRVTIEQRVPGVDATFGDVTGAWSALATVWASFAATLDTDAGGAEVVRDRQRVLVRQTQVRIRFRSDVTTSMRVSLADGSRTLQIVSIAEVGRREALDLMCEDYDG